MTVELYPARFLPRLPAPWRLRLQLGETVIDCTSADHEPNGWCRSETLYVLAAALEDRLTPAAAAKSAASRVRKAIKNRATWDQVSGGLVGVDPRRVEGSVGEALRKLGATLLGEWSGDAAEVRGHGQGV